MPNCRGRPDRSKSVSFCFPMDGPRAAGACGDPLTVFFETGDFDTLAYIPYVHSAAAGKRVAGMEQALLDRRATTPVFSGLGDAPDYSSGMQNTVDVTGISSGCARAASLPFRWARPVAWSAPRAARSRAQGAPCRRSAEFSGGCFQMAPGFFAVLLPVRYNVFTFGNEVLYAPRRLSAQFIGGRPRGHTEVRAERGILDLLDEVYKQQASNTRLKQKAVVHVVPKIFRGRTSCRRHSWVSPLSHPRNSEGQCHRRLSCSGATEARDVKRHAPSNVLLLAELEEPPRQEHAGCPFSSPSSHMTLRLGAPIPMTASATRGARLRGASPRRMTC